MSRGIIGSFETWKQGGVPYPCLRGDIEKTAGLTVYEPDEGMVHFARWRPIDQNAVSRSAVPPPAREEDGTARRVAPTRSRVLARDVSNWPRLRNEPVQQVSGLINNTAVCAGNA
jgi:hypothetical protein